MTILSGTKRAIALRDLKERLLFDFVPARTIVALGGLLLGLMFLLAGKSRKGAEALARIHRAGLNRFVDRVVEKVFRDALRGDDGRLSSGLRAALSGYPESVEQLPQTVQFHQAPERLLGGCMAVLKSPSENERGVLYLYYSYVYPLLLRYFDSEAIASRYHIVVEPSWSGYCDLNILCLHRLGRPVFVGSIEPRDTELLRSLQANFIPVHMGGNTWVDAEVFKPLPGTEKDIDVVCVSSWAWYKRHWAIFRALGILKRRGVRLRVALIGYSIDLTLDEIRQQARHYDVEDLLEFHERLTPAEVNVMLNRSKVNLLWSRREGVNRAIIEGMAAGVPCVLRQGFNYGYHYPYINDRTGAFASEHELPDVLIRMVREHRSFSPRSTVLSEMTPEASTARLNSAIRSVALRDGENWTTDLALKVNTLDGLGYKNRADSQRFEDDYRFLRERITKR